ncbi:rhomboid family intramembrane serine protease GlpG [Alteromonas pelagimontana]|uniref:Rhomboid family intramembrane serine protease GlpG n=1 Tax=Alteromonas pelagimontana TaxID=1858656 RepID=A0A6M4MD77_9ALTE|nr:rhomboid family intramembrane serine protease GlpG [Alteromonas pelagimontana]QJR81039.1 rhomboid family intramembrane serine protease GlpG [Alteromonas pelagimontana]
MTTPLISIRNESYAHLLANYLTSRGMPAQVQSPVSSGEYVVLLQEQSDIDAARVVCDDFIRQPNHPKYQQAAWQNGESVILTRGSGYSFAGLMRWGKLAPLTALVLFTCTAIFALSLLGLFEPLARVLMMQPLPVLMNSHEWWRLLGPAFIHFSALHFIFNMLWWSMLGSQIEQKLGLSMLLLVLLISAIVSNVAQVVVSGPAFGGLSGVVYALLGFIWWIGWLKPGWGLALPKSIIGFMLVWLVIGYADLLWVNMANTAHTVGLISGCALAGILSVGSDRRGRAQST